MKQDKEYNDCEEKVVVIMNEHRPFRSGSTSFFHFVGSATSSNKHGNFKFWSNGIRPVQIIEVEK